MPVRLEGSGLSLRPNVGYTSEKLAKKHLRKSARRKIKKVKEKAVEKILKDDQKMKKVKSLLKGIL